MQIHRLHEDVRVDSSVAVQRPSATPFATHIGDRGVLVAWQNPAGIGLQVLTYRGGLVGPPRQIRCRAGPCNRSSSARASAPSAYGSIVPPDTSSPSASDRTVTLVISHNLLTVTDADQILFLERGHITGAGTHPHMLARHPGYAYLFRLHQQPSPRQLPPLPFPLPGPLGRIPGPARR